MMVALSQPSAGAWAGPAVATAGVIRRDKVFTSLEESEQVALGPREKAAEAGEGTESPEGWSAHSSPEF